MYSNTPTTIPGYGAHHRHHSDLGEALGVFALLSLVLRDPIPGKAIGELVAALGMLLGALLGVGLFIHLWPASPVLVGLIGVGWFLVNQRSDSDKLREVLTVELARRTYYLNELALVATPQELAIVPNLWDVTEVSFASRDAVCALETRWDATFPRAVPLASRPTKLRAPVSLRTARGTPLRTTHQHQRPRRCRAAHSQTRPHHQADRPIRG